MLLKVLFWLHIWLLLFHSLWHDIHFLLYDTERLLQFLLITLCFIAIFQSLQNLRLSWTIIAIITIWWTINEGYNIQNTFSVADYWSVYKGIQKRATAANMNRIRCHSLFRKPTKTTHLVIPGRILSAPLLSYRTYVQNYSIN